MAESKKFLTEYEINVESSKALDSLKNVYIGFEKAAQGSEAFAKALKSNTSFQRSFNDAMSEISKTTKRMSDVSKIQIMPKKQFLEFIGTVNTLQDSYSTLSKTNVFDEAMLSQVQKTIESITNRFLKHEEVSEKILETTEDYKEVLKDLKDIQKGLSNQSSDFSISTKEIKNEYLALNGQVNDFVGKMKESVRTGKTSEEQLKNYLSSFKIVNQRYEALVNLQQTALKSSSSTLGKINSLLKTSNHLTAENAKDLQEMQKTLEVFAQQGEASNKQLSEFEEKTENILQQTKKIVALENRLSEARKSEKDAATLIVNYQAELVELSKELSNVGLKKQYDEARKSIEVMIDDLKDSLYTNKEDSNIIREKIALLKKEGESLVDINNQQKEIKKLDDDSVASIVKRAQKQNEINKAWRTERKGQGVGGAFDAAKNKVKGLGSELTSKFGEAGVVLGKAFSKLGPIIASAFAPLAAFTSIIGAIKLMFDLEKQIKTARKQMFLMAMDTHTGAQAFDDISKGADISTTEIDALQKKTLDFAWTLGMSSDQVVEAMKAFTSEGFGLTSAMSGLEEFTGVAASIGMELGDATKRAGELRTNFGLSLGEISQAFVTLQKQSKNAGMTTARFFDRVMNAATGLALYGQKIDVVGGVFSKLVKSMKLPESVATDVAANLAKGFLGLSTEMQVTTFMLGKGEQQYKNYSARQKKGLKERIDQLGSEIAAEKDSEKKSALIAEQGSKQRELRNIAETDSLKGLTGMMMKARKMDIGSEIMMQLQAAGSQFGIDFGANIEDVDSKMSKSMFEMEKIGELFGINKESIMGLQNAFQNLAGNVKDLKDFSKNSNQKESVDAMDGLVDVLGGSQRIENKLKKIIKANSGDLKSSRKEFAKQFPDLIDTFDSFEKTYKEKGAFDYNKFGQEVDNAMTPTKKEDMVGKYLQVLAGTSNQNLPKLKELLAKLAPKLSTEIMKANSVDALKKLATKIDTNFDLAAKLTELVATKQEKGQSALVGKQMLQSTKSTEEALNNTITKYLQGMFTFMEKIFNLLTFLNHGTVRDYNKMIDALQVNKDVAEKNQKTLQGQESDSKLQIKTLEAIEQKTPEQEKQLKDEQDRLAEILKKKSAFEGVNAAISSEMQKGAEAGKFDKKDIDAISDLLSKMSTEGLASFNLAKTGAPTTQKQAQTSGAGAQGFASSVSGLIQDEFEKSQAEQAKDEQEKSKQAKRFQKEVSRSPKLRAYKDLKIKSEGTIISADNAKISTLNSESKDANFKAANATIEVEKQEATDEDVGNALGFKKTQFDQIVKNMTPDQKSNFGKITGSSSKEIIKSINDNFKKAGMNNTFSTGGVVPGTSFSGDKISAKVNSGELIVPQKIWQNATVPTINPVALASLVDSVKNSSGSSQNKTINDNRTINMYVNQTDKRVMEQIALNAMYTDKK